MIQKMQADGGTERLLHFPLLENIVRGFEKSGGGPVATTFDPEGRWTPSFLHVAS
jgi:hypothetical protein